ncbi:MAG TPA: pyridoxamine 5'-phosphate oxidase family protein [Bryobacteraceae bacterium]|nr:pyridoxamine 5'-phosphate oxidase family protein [Bryobacteraceae bacterium]
MERTHEENVAKLAKLLKGIRIGMLTTAQADGTLRSRPMATQQTEFDGVLWFFTELSSAKTDEIEQDHHVNISYAKPDDQVYVSVSGRARSVRDLQKAKELWNPMNKAWFPNGPEDPNVGLLRVEVDQAEYWDSPSNPVVHMIGFAKAIATGKRYADEGTDHAKVTF